MTSNREQQKEELRAGLLAKYPGLQGNLAACVKASLAEKSFIEFVRQAWHVIVPNAPFVEGKHHKIICDHLEAVTRGEITRLTIAVPPRSSKTLVVSVLWAAWEWTQDGFAGKSYLCTSHSMDLIGETSVTCRALLDSEWYQARWGLKWNWLKDQNKINNYKNDVGGQRIAAVMSSLTGRGGSRIIIDDPTDTHSGVSKGKLESVIHAYTQALGARINDPGSTAIVIIMQRVHQMDLIGYIKANEDNWVHLNIPAEFVPKEKCVTKWGSDWRTKAGEPMWPEQWGRYPGGVAKFLKDWLSKLGAYGYACQMQQTPIPASGAIFNVDWLGYFPALPRNDIYFYFTSWDLAVKAKDSNDFTVGVVVAYNTRTRVYYIIDLIRRKIEFTEQCKLIAQTSYKYPQCKFHIVEDKQSGSAIIQHFSKNADKYNGRIIGFDPKTTEKEVRFRAVSPIIEAGGLKLLYDGTWVKDFKEEMEYIPLGSYDDQIDAVTQAMLWNENRDPLPEELPIIIDRPGSDGIAVSLWMDNPTLPPFR
jgi:predicted phage terminase large subunit-like protein